MKKKELKNVDGAEPGYPVETSRNESSASEASALTRTTRRRFLKRTGAGLGVVLGAVTIPQHARATGPSYYYFVGVSMIGMQS